MKKLPSIAAAAVLVFALSACGGGNQQTQPDNNQPDNNQPAAEAPAGNYDAATAEAAFKNKCASCHGQNLEGAVGPKLSDIGSRLSQDEILNVIENGKNTMPPGLSKGDEAAALAAWLADKK